MNFLKTTLVALCLFFATNLMANAETIGYANFTKIESEYNFAKASYKKLDNQYLAMQQFVIDKDKQFKTIDSPIKKKNFEEKTKKEFDAKEKAYRKAKLATEDQIYRNIMHATKAIAGTKNIDVVLDYRVIFTGGVDLSNDIVKYLNANKPIK